MAFLDGQISFTNSSILIIAITFTINKIVEKKYGLKFQSDLEMVDYILDKGIDRAIVTQPKINLLLQKLGFKKKPQFEQFEQVSNISNIPKTNLTKKSEDQIQMLQNEIAKIDARSGLVLSEMQLELDHIKDKMQKAVDGLDFNNGDDEIEESPKKPDLPNVDTTHIKPK